MNPLDVVRLAAVAGIDLNVRDGQLYAQLPVATPPDLLPVIRAHKPAIVAALAGWPQCAPLRHVTLERCRPLVPNDLTAAERTEAEALASELAGSGGLGWFVICLIGRWNDLSDRDRLAAAWCWEFAVAMPGVSIAA